MSSSSMDQAFVKAFARRNRSGHQQPTGPVRSKDNRTAPTENPRPVVAEPVVAEPVVAKPVVAEPAGAEPGALKVDRSVAKTAEVWIDPIEDQIARADLASADVPKPHVDPPRQPAVHPSQTPANTTPPSQQRPTEEPSSSPLPASPLAAVETVDSLQHIHTAYAAAVTEIPILPSEPAGRSNMDAAVATPATVAPSTTDATLEVAQTPVIESPPTESPSTEEPATGNRVTEDPIGDVTEVEEPPTAPPALTEMRIDPPAAPSKALQSIVPFQPAWEVDVFDIPTSVADLFFEGVLFQQIAERMSDAVANGLGSVLVTSTKQGEGRSSVAIGMAMASAAAGIRVALVDADTEEPTLADDLRLDLRYGWADTIRGGLPIKEVAVLAVEDGVTLIPLMPPSGRNAATAFEVVQLIELLREKFELIIIDGPTAASPHLHQCASAVDSAIIVRDMTRTDTYAINDFSYRLRESGVQGVGVVENYV